MGFESEIVKFEKELANKKNNNFATIEMTDFQTTFMILLQNAFDNFIKII